MLNCLTMTNHRTLYYAGIGSRKIPKGVPLLMMKLASRLEDLGFTLRSGGADGSDTAFELGAINKEIYLPWKAFNGNDSTLYGPTNEAFSVAKYNHPAWSKLTEPARKLMARNSHQVLGPSIDSETLRSTEENLVSDFIVCWTPDGVERGIDTSEKTGGTGQAIRIAYYHEIPVFNLFNNDAMNRLKCHIESHPRYKK
jgi:hypothetical protein